MNTSNLNRSVLAAVIGTVLAASAVAPAQAQSWRQRGSAQDASSASTQQDGDSREDRRKEREAAAKKEREAAESARKDAAHQREQVQQQQRDQSQQQQREQAQVQQRDQSQQREQMQRAQQEREQAQSQREQMQRARDDDNQAQREVAQAERERARDQAREQRPGDRQQREDRNGDVADARDRQQQERQDQRDQRQSDRDGRQDQRQPDRDGRPDQRHADLPPPRRLENRERDQRIVQERQQAHSYQQAIQTRIAPQAKYYAESLNHQHRSHGYHYQQQYYWRLMQMLNAWNWSSYNYYNDPYFYTADDYRYNRGGSWYSVNRYGADILRQAVNYGYQEGLYAGQADQMDGWRFDYRGAWVYRDANYGYRGFYVNQGDYNYYFREGFRRGYEDGYYQRYRYGRDYNGSGVILGTVLSGILNLQAYRW